MAPPHATRGPSPCRANRCTVGTGDLRSSGMEKAAAAVAILVSIVGLIGSLGNLTRSARLTRQLKDEVAVLVQVPEGPARDVLRSHVERNVWRLCALEDPGARVRWPEIVEAGFTGLIGLVLLAVPDSPAWLRVLGAFVLFGGVAGVRFEVTRSRKDPAQAGR